eukprot:Tbor_TRINITY_DN930_c0_g1::TRINITY_DN930_c0_g1_i1::g.21204::m.21204
MHPQSRTGSNISVNVNRGNPYTTTTATNVSKSIYDQCRFAPYLKNLHQLTIHDEEYHRIAYMLRASLSSLTVKILSIHAVNSPHQDAVFESNHIGITTLDSWVNSSDLPDQNSISNIISHGGRFRITDADKGAIFTVGGIQMDERTVAAGPAQYEFLHCRVATGRSFVVDAAQVGVHGIPAGYDSMVIHKDPQNTPVSSNPNDNNYFQEYIISDESSIYPDFVVNFVFDVATDRRKSVPQCEACESRPAFVFCMQDNAKLCTVCDNEMHSRSVIQARHTRVKLDDMQNSVGMTFCKEHTNMPVQFYDPIAHVPVCVHCKMSGSHSAGENAKHPLVPIQDAYISTMEELERETALIQDRRQTIFGEIASIEKRMDAVNTNHEKCQEQIHEIVQQVIQVLHEETQSKLSALLSDETELRRQLDFYDWSEGFLNYQKSSLNPVEFLPVFKTHSSILAQAPSEIVDGAATVRADMRVMGRLDVVIDDGSSPNAPRNRSTTSNVNIGAAPTSGLVMPPPAYRSNNQHQQMRKIAAPDRHVGIATQSIPRYNVSHQ